MNIGKLSNLTGISEYTLRYYENKGLIHVNRDEHGRRDYAQSDIAWVNFLQRLKDTGMLLKDIKVYADLRYQGDTTMAQRLALLQTHRTYVLEQQKKWQAYLEHLDQKIQFYEDAIHTDNNKKD